MGGDPVFISYSSQDRDLADVVRSYLETQGRSVWIAPRDVPAGMSYPEAIIGAIRDCRTGLLVLSEQSNQSQHVLREIERISSDRKPLYVLRVDDVEISDGLAYFASLLQWVDAPRARLQSDPASVLLPIFGTDANGAFAPGRRTHTRDLTRPPSNAMAAANSRELNFSALADAQRRMLTTFGVAVLDYLCQRPNPATPISRRELLAHLTEADPGVFDGLSPRQFESLLNDAQANGCAPGMSENEEGLFVVEENIAVKLERNQVAKALIARHAVKQVRDNMVIAVDGGSTTLPIVENILSAVEAGDLKGVTLVTNSLTSAQVVSEFMSSQGWTDETALVALHLVGGAVRPNTHATTWGEHVEREGTELLQELGQGDTPIDVGFIGGNGFDLEHGVTMGSAAELGFKRFVLAHSKAPFVVADSSKALITLDIQIACWHDRFTLLTNVLTPDVLLSLDELVLAGKIVEVRE